MKYLICDFYENYECIGSQCPSTCCAGWNIFLDKETKSIYDNIDGEFGQILRKNILPVSDSVFKISLCKDGRCPFLTSENLCEIYQKIGYDKMSYVCRTYPRTIEEYGDISFCTLTLSCPEVSRILLTRTTPISFFFWEDDKRASQKTEAFDWNFFNTLMTCFTFSIDLVQNRAYSLSTRLRLLLIFTNTLQTLLDNHMDITPLIEAFSSPEYLHEQADSLSALPSNTTAIFSAFLHFLSLSRNISEMFFLLDITEALNHFIHSHEETQILEHFQNVNLLLSAPAYDIQYEHLCVYFLFRYYFRAYETKNPLEEVAQLIYLLLIYRGYALPSCTDEKSIPAEKQISLFSSVSRVFDHNKDNLKLLSSNFKKDGQQDISLLLSLI